MDKTWNIVEHPTRCFDKSQAAWITFYILVLYDDGEKKATEFQFHLLCWSTVMLHICSPLIGFKFIQTSYAEGFSFFIRHLSMNYINLHILNLDETAEKNASNFVSSVEVESFESLKSSVRSRNNVRLKKCLCFCCCCCYCYCCCLKNTEKNTWRNFNELPLINLPLKLIQSPILFNCYDSAHVKGFVFHSLVENFRNLHTRIPPSANKSL